MDDSLIFDSTNREAEVPLHAPRFRRRIPHVATNDDADYWLRRLREHTVVLTGMVKNKPPWFAITLLRAVVAINAYEERSTIPELEHVYAVLLQSVSRGLTYWRSRDLSKILMHWKKVNYQQVRDALAK